MPARMQVCCAERVSQINFSLRIRSRWKNIQIPKTKDKPVKIQTLFRNRQADKHHKWKNTLKKLTDNDGPS